MVCRDAFAACPVPHGRGASEDAVVPAMFTMLAMVAGRLGHPAMQLAAGEDWDICIDGGIAACAEPLLRPMATPRVRRRDDRRRRTLDPRGLRHPAARAGSRRRASRRLVTPGPSPGHAAPLFSSDAPVRIEPIPLPVVGHRDLRARLRRKPVAGHHLTEAGRPAGRRRPPQRQLQSFMEQIMTTLIASTSPRSSTSHETTS